MRNLLTLLAASLSVAACIYPYDPELDEAPEGVLSVDGNICIGEVSTVRLGTLLSLSANSTDTRADLSDAKVWVEDEDGNEYPGTPAYTPYGYDFGSSLPAYSIDTRDAPPDRRYRLRIEALGATYGSDWSAVARPPVIREVTFADDDNNVTVNVSLDGGDGDTGYVLLSYREAWEFHVDYYPHYKVDTDSWSIEEDAPDFSRYRCWKTTEDNRVTPIDYTDLEGSGFRGFPLTGFSRRDDRNHGNYCISVTASSISKETYRFLKNLEDNTDGGDNLFTPNPGEIAGNLHCESDPGRMVLGYAVFSRTVTKRAWLDGRYYLPTPRYTLLYPILSQYADFWTTMWRPLEEHTGEYDMEKEGPYGWGPPRCYDCTAAGGTLKKPEWATEATDNE